MTEFMLKQERIRALLAAHRVDALLLRRVSSFAWATCGAASYINTAATDGEAMLLITLDACYLITNNIEEPRLRQDQRIAAQGWEFCIAPWHEANSAIADLTHGCRLGVDGAYPSALDLSAEVAKLRAALTPAEGARFRGLGRLCAEAMYDAVYAVQPGQTGYEIGARLIHKAERRRVQATVNLIALDEEIFSFRHPLPSGKTLERYAMLILCGRRDGLVCSITRLVHFGKLPESLRRKAEALARIDAAFIDATRHANTLDDALRCGITAYIVEDFPDEWRLHHQGGLAGYEPREIKAVPGLTDVIQSGQAFAWNPSITGTKSEDTILVTEAGPEVLTAIDGWPTYSVAIEGRDYQRPAILEVL